MPQPRPDPQDLGPHAEKARYYDTCDSCKPKDGRNNKAFIQVLFGGLLVVMCRECFKLLTTRGRREL